MKPVAALVFSLAFVGNPVTQDAFSICTFNILCETYCRADVYLPRLCDAKYLKWDYRRDLVLGEILRTSPDVICLQARMLLYYSSFSSFNTFDYAGGGTGSLPVFPRPNTTAFELPWRLQTKDL